MKAAVLSRLAKTDVAVVPEGWCLSLHDNTADDIQTAGDLEYIWGEMSCQGCKLVVRSSASVEDLPFALFAGRFASQLDVSSRADLLDAVKQVEESIDGVAVRDYLEAFGLPRDTIKMSVLIQRQVEAYFSGVTFTRSPEGFSQYDMFVEVIQGRSAPLLLGEQAGATYGLRRLSDPHGDGVHYDHLAGPDYDPQIITELLPRVFDVCLRIENELEAPQDIEWVWDGTHLWVVQARELVPDAPIVPDGYQLGSFSGTSAATPLLKSLKRSKEWGLKGAAEQYFERNGLGAANTDIVLPTTSLEDVEQILKVRALGSHGTVLRFSHRAQVGLPKRFVPVGESVFAAFKAARGDHDDWVGIVSDYIFIESSFEAYVTTSTLLVEHVPGNWEPDNTLAPDLFKFTEQGTEIYKYMDYRLAKIEAPNAGSLPHAITRRIAPLQDDKALQWAEQFMTHFQQIRHDFQRDLPINVHFIVDRADRFYYMNIRPTSKLEVLNLGRIEVGAAYKPNRYFTVSDPRDVASWDGVSRILVDCVADRGHESRIAGVAVALRNAGVQTVFCTFGLLSHPAIVLREFQLRVEPLYIRHELLTANQRW